jgi:hypothetical protein
MVFDGRARRGGMQTKNHSDAAGCVVSVDRVHFLSTTAAARRIQPG